MKFGRDPALAVLDLGGDRGEIGGMASLCACVPLFSR